MEINYTENPIFGVIRPRFHLLAPKQIVPLNS